MSSEKDRCKRAKLCTYVHIYNTHIIHACMCNCVYICLTKILDTENSSLLRSLHITRHTLERRNPTTLSTYMQEDTLSCLHGRFKCLEVTTIFSRNLLQLRPFHLTDPVECLLVRVNHQGPLLGTFHQDGIFCCVLTERQPLIMPPADLERKH